MRNILLMVIIVGLSIESYAANTLTISNAEVTGVRTYETADGSIQVLIRINGKQRVGPNPDAISTDCELWTHSKEVFSTALAAKSSGQRVNVRYVSKQTGNDAFCKVSYLELLN